MTLIAGVDISHQNGNVDFHALRARGCRFVLIKASEGTSFVDPMFSHNWQAAKAAGLYVGAYHFHRPNTNGRAQADYFLRVLDRYAARHGSGVLMPFLDCEATDGHAPQTVAANAIDFLTETHHGVGRTPGIYLSPGFLGSGIARDRRLASYYLWLAKWQSSHTRAPAAPSPFHSGSEGPGRVTFWQWDGTGTDDDVFNGSLAQLQAQASVVAPPHSTSEPTIREGSTGSAVSECQRQLNARGGYRLTVDGDFGPKTKSTVQAWQRRNHLTPDGVVGPRTWRTLGH